MGNPRSCALASQVRAEYFCDGVKKRLRLPRWPDVVCAGRNGMPLVTSTDKPIGTDLAPTIIAISPSAETRGLVEDKPVEAQ